ncbi:hypothetical protein D3C87_1998630 [compost metagenome]
MSKAAEAAYLLDQEMSSIRGEIMASQRMFEDNSNLVNRVLSNIQELYFYHRVREAAQFQLRFNEIWETEEGLSDLSADIEAAIARAKKGDNS